MNTEILNRTNAEKQKLITDLHAQLEWYTKEASEEEFDPKAVESILYLLDIYDPMDENDTDVEEAWKHFAEKMEVGEPAIENEQTKTKDAGLSSKKVVNFMASARKKNVVVAAVLVLLLLALVGTTRAEAIKTGGFFYWLRQDNEGRQMITVPENLESTVDFSVCRTYYDREELPTWCKNLLEIESGFGTEEFLEWKYIDVVQVGNYNAVKSCYTDLFTQQEIIIGMLTYDQKVTVSTEVFDGYSHMENNGDESDIAHIYSKVEENGEISYRVCEFVGSNIYFVEGKDLEALKNLAKKYLKN